MIINSPGGLIVSLINLLVFLIFVEVVISNIIAFSGKLSPYHPVVRAVRSIVNPILNPLRRLLPPPQRTGGWDFAPLLAMVLLQMLAGMIAR